MKPTVVADEMFPEGAGPYMDLEEVIDVIMKWVYEFTKVLSKKKFNGLIK